MLDARCWSSSACRSASTAARRSRRRSRRTRSSRQSSPRRGAAASETRTMAVTQRTIVGPVGSRSVSDERTEPSTPRGRRRAPPSRPEPEPVGPLPRRRGGRDQHRRHQHHADRLQADHDRDDEQRGEQDVERADREAEAGPEVRVEREQLELLPDEQHHAERDRGQDAIVTRSRRRRPAACPNRNRSSPPGWRRAAAG